MRDIILTNYIKAEDPQKQHEYTDENKEKILLPLKDSVEALGLELVVLEGEGDPNPFFQRWANIEKYLEENEDIDGVFCVDCSDVIVLHNPFPVRKGMIYCGSDYKNPVGEEWMMLHHLNPEELDFTYVHKSKIMLNAGILGGTREMVLEFVKKINHMRSIFDKDKSFTDMCIFNMIGYLHFSNTMITGYPLHTGFKNYEVNDAWFKHK